MSNKINFHHDVCKSVSDMLEAKMLKVQSLSRRKEISREEFIKLLELFKKITAIEYE
jgi:hypothetical protein